LIPPAKRGGNRRHVNVREVVNGIMYVLSTGCQWRAVPKDLPPRSTLFSYLDCGFRGLRTGIPIDCGH
jgi:transposase